MQEKYILQYGSLAGWPYKIAEGLRDKSIVSQNVILYDRDVLDMARQLSYDRALCKFNDSMLIKAVSILKYMLEVPKKVDLIHYHSGTVFLRQFHHLFEGPYFKRKNIPMLLSFGGSDVRIISEARKNNPYFYLQNNSRHDDKVKRKLESMSKNIRFCATDPEMLGYGYINDFFEKSYLFRQPVNLQEIECVYPKLDQTVPVILHIPTNSEVKGTKYVQSVIDRLAGEGLKFEFKFIRNLTQKEMYLEITNSDIYIDELLLGCHGVTAVETMAAGKPTLTYIREDLVDSFPIDFPIVNVNPDTLYAKLKELILDSSLRHKIGVASRKYVEKYHDVNVVTQDLIEIYREIGYTK
ncbi:MAG: glycosyltransferase [Cycloclasticus sp.]|jgi:Glycosyltransferase